MHGSYLGQPRREAMTFGHYRQTLTIYYTEQAVISVQFLDSAKRVSVLIARNILRQFVSRQVSCLKRNSGLLIRKGQCP
jgi:hypothetical protein